MQKYEVYHTTYKTFGKNILKTKSFKCSDGESEWLGKGVYFWDNLYTANDFWPKARKINKKDIMVLKANLEVDKVYILNLDEEDQHKNFEEFCDDLKGELIKRNVYIPVGNRKKLWCFYLNYYKRLYDVALITRTFTAGGHNKIFDVNRKQYCVSEKFKDSIIKNVEEVV